MLLHETKQELFLGKIKRRKEEIANYMISGTQPIKGITLRETKAYETYHEGILGTDFRPIQPGETWGPGTNGWFKLHIRVPEEWKSREVAAFLDFGGESCAYLNGAPSQGLDHYHKELLLTTCARGGEMFDLVVDAASARPWVPDETEKVTFRRAEIAVRNPEVREYWFNLEMLHLLAAELPRDSARRVRIIYTLNKSVDAFDYTHTDPDSLKRSAVRANAILKPLLACKADASATSVAAHGHSHIDVAWLWPYRETKRKCARTFSTVMRLMEQYPEYIFTQSQAQLYEFTKENHPALYEEIRERVKEGRWEVTGSMWVEADCNLSGGEALVRQVLLGKNFFRDEFGIETDVLWLPDVFGYSAALPQILQRARVPYFSTIKISWNQFNKFPCNTFYWYGIDGTRVLAHFPPTGDYNAYPDPARLRQQVNAFKEKDRCEESLLSYGWGDGGGGPDSRHLEFLRRAANLEGLPRCRQKTVTQFFHGIDGTPDLPSWVGELYLELHRGTYTTQGHNKRNNRKAELLYRDAEILASAAGAMGYAYPYEDLHQHWKKLLCNQFHDVLPGSSIRQVYEDTDRMYPEIFRAGETVTSDALAAITREIDTTGEGQPVVVFNTLSWQRTDIARVKAPWDGDWAVLGPDGREVPSQRSGDQIIFTATVPSMGYAVYRLVPRASAPARTGLKANGRAVENRLYRIRLDAHGLITSIVHKQTGREVLPKGARTNLLRLFEDKPQEWEAWDIDFYHEDKGEDLTQADSVRVVETGPVFAAIEVRRSFGASRLKQTMRVYADVLRIDFDTWVDWHEAQKVLKVAFPSDLNASTARYEIQFGNVERPTHTNTSWDAARFEVCAHKWADISEEDFGVSLMNDCKYGHQAKGSEMRLTLLRSPKSPDAEADMGEHVFTYSLMPHAGDYAAAGTVRQAYELNVPLRAVAVEASDGTLPTEHSFVAVDAPNVVVEAVKRAEKQDCTVLRLYECHNQRSEVTVTTALPLTRVSECDLMEDSIKEMETDGRQFTFQIRPFEIRTFKLE